LAESAWGAGRGKEGIKKNASSDKEIGTSSGKIHAKVRDASERRDGRKTKNRHGQQTRKLPPASSSYSKSATEVWWERVFGQEERKEDGVQD